MLAPAPMKIERDTTISFHTDSSTTGLGFCLTFVPDRVYEVDVDIPSLTITSSIIDGILTTIYVDNYLVVLPAYLGNVEGAASVGEYCAPDCTEFIQITDATGGTGPAPSGTDPLLEASDAFLDDTNFEQGLVQGTLKILTLAPVGTFYNATLIRVDAPGRHGYADTASNIAWSQRGNEFSTLETVISTLGVSATVADPLPNSTFSIAQIACDFSVLPGRGSPPSPLYVIRIARLDENGVDIRSDGLKIPVVDVGAMTPMPKAWFGDDLNPEARKLSGSVTVYASAHTAGLTGYRGYWADSLDGSDGSAANTEGSSASPTTSVALNIVCWDGNRLVFLHRTGFRPVSYRTHRPCYSVLKKESSLKVVQCW